MGNKFRRDIVCEKIKICLKTLPFVIPVRMMLKAHLLYLNKEEKKYEGWEKRDPEESSWYRNDLERRRKELINKIREEAGTSSLKESFYEAFGQSLTQLMIMASTGSVSYAQLISVPIGAKSFLCCFEGLLFYETR